ncbi:hypothetical protein [Crateriforma conspicua]|uniref:hypothetical protein n=1 Tax=Crateriforma conspicua TaxID=2527996 RepID=UPI00118A2F7D|nr:hypothetical protein [Crateriforma conspicua]QDV63028.1 hypothetical protein Mal65_21660 [Crateriforma conspicua]
MNPFSLFSSGKLPEEGVSLCNSERTIWTLEDVSGSVTMINFRRPGKRCSWNRRWFRGSMIATEKRLVAFAYKTRLIHVPFDDPRWAQIDVHLPNGRTLFIGHDASLFHDDWSGTLEYRFKAGGKTRFRDLVKTMTT